MAKKYDTKYVIWKIEKAKFARKHYCSSDKFYFQDTKNDEEIKRREKEFVNSMLRSSNDIKENREFENLNHFIEYYEEELKKDKINEEDTN